MSNLTKLNWPGGWNPSQDARNGDPNTLLRMDNLQQDQEGILGLARANSPVKTLEDVITAFYSKSYDGVDYIYTGIGNCKAVQEFRLDGTQRFTGNIIDSAIGNPVFGDAYGLVLATAGAQRKKFDGINAYQLGLETPVTPIRSKNSAGIVESFIENAGVTDIDPSVQEGAAWNLAEGSGLFNVTSVGAYFFPDDQTNRGVLECDFATPLDVLNIGTLQSQNPGNDTFLMDVQLSDSNAFDSIRVKLNLDTLGQNYFWFEWDVATSTEFSLGVDAWSLLSATRSQFNRQGNDSTLDWTDIMSIQITASALTNNWVGILAPRFAGGATGQLLGTYQYIYRYVKDMGTYLAKSPFSPVSEAFTIVNGSLFILPHAPTDQSIGSGLQDCTIEYYRRSVPSTASYYNSLTEQFAQLPDLLDQFYLIASGQDPNGYYQDTDSDVTILEEDTPANLFLDSIQNIPEDIVGMVGIYNDRILYLSSTSLYLSERLDPDCFDSRYTLKFTGDPFDKNFWLKPINNATMLLGTSHDLYEISGTLLDLPDGSLDINVYAFGEAYPPICADVTDLDGIMFYVGADGVRTSSGSNSTILNPHLKQLFQGITCHGIPPIQIFSGGVQRYYLTIGHGKLYLALPHTDGLRRLFIYDIFRQTWTMRSTFLTGLWTTAQENVIAAQGPACILLDSGSTYVNTVDQPINLLTVYDHNGTPRNRKDTETLKLVIDTGGENLDVYLGVMKDTGTSMNFVKTIQASGLQTIFIELKDPTLSLGFRYALQLISSGLKAFLLAEYTIEYLERPEQINYIRVPNTNLGSTARKRFISIPFVIDTLGSTVQISALVDNVLVDAVQTGLASIDQKQTVIFYFQSEIVGTDIGFIVENLSGLPFEFSGPDYSKAVSEEMPPPAEFLRIPPNDFGSPNRKRATSIKFEMNTRGQNVLFVPRFDQVDFEPITVNSGEDKKKIFEYFVNPSLGDFTWFMLAATFASEVPAPLTPFELYGTLVPQNLEIFPPRLESLYTAETNYGAPQRKRIRTLPIIINTNGSNVTYQPYVDGVAYPPTVLNSAKKATLYHFFATDSFGIDYAGFFSGTAPFEFYEMGQPLDVETLPVPRKFDQLGPMRFDKIGKLFALRMRVVLVGSTTQIPFSLYGDDQEMDSTYDPTPRFSGVFNIVPGRDQVVQVNLPKSVNGTIFRLTLGPTTDPFHRFDLQAKVQISGMETDAKWVPIR